MCTMNKMPVILDVDTGSDDAVAIMAAIYSEKLSVKAICTVWGNLSINNTTRNTIDLCSAIGEGIPVYQGCSDAMVRSHIKGREMINSYVPLVKDGVVLKIHYERLHGLDDSGILPQDQHAVDFYYEYLTETTEPVTIIAVSPLTNLGFLFKLNPDLSKKIDQLIIMGGGIDLTNASPSGEANIWHDPEALQCILDTGIKPVLVPLDATHSVPIDLPDCEKLEALDTFAGHFTARLIRERIEFDRAQWGNDHAWTAVHDALAVVSVICPDVFTDIREEYISVGLSGVCDGEILIDRSAHAPMANSLVAYKADHGIFMHGLLSLFKKRGVL